MVFKPTCLCGFRWGIGATMLIMWAVCGGLGRVYLTYINTTLTPLCDPSDCSTLMIQKPAGSDLWLILIGTLCIYSNWMTRCCVIRSWYMKRSDPPLFTFQWRDQGSGVGNQPYRRSNVPTSVVDVGIPSLSPLEP